MKSKFLLWAVILLFFAVVVTIIGVLLKINDLSSGEPLIIGGAIVQGISMILLIIYGITTRRRERM